MLWLRCELHPRGAHGYLLGLATPDGQQQLDSDETEQREGHPLKPF